MVAATPLERLLDLPRVPLAEFPTPIEEAGRLRDALGGGFRLFVKRDDAISFAFGGNKVRKLELVASEASCRGADVLVTCGGVQSNHARATAAVAARLGLGCVIVANGAPPERATANALLRELLGAEVDYVDTREAREPRMLEIGDRLRAQGRTPFLIPLGASTPLGALAYARAVAEIQGQMPPPDWIFHATSSGGTQAGLLVGCALLGLDTPIVGISADDPASVVGARVGAIAAGALDLLRCEARVSSERIRVDDGFVGEGYGIETAASRQALRLAARTEALFLDPVYTAKAMAGLIAHVGSGRIGPNDVVLFWHTGGQVALFR